MTIAAGIDVGTGAVKAALFRIEGDRTDWLGRATLRIRQRDPMELARSAFDQVLADAKLSEKNVDYVATTGEGEGVPFHTGHFYSMTTHARGAIYLDPESRAALDVGALHGRAISIDERGKVLSYKMTSQCASGSGQFLENIARYLGIAQEEIGGRCSRGTGRSRTRTGWSSCSSAPCRARRSRWRGRAAPRRRAPRATPDRGRLRRAHGSSSSRNGRYGTVRFHLRPWSQHN